MAVVQIKCKHCVDTGVSHDGRDCMFCPKGGNATSPPKQETPKQSHPGAKYLRTIRGLNGQTAIVDVYDVLYAFDITDPAIAHAIKKLLCAGQRGVKSKLQDYAEAVVSTNRAIDNEAETQKKDRPSNHPYEG